LAELGKHPDSLEILIGLQERILGGFVL